MARTFRRPLKLIADFAADTRGATAIEYALVAVGVAGLVVAAVYTLGGTVSTTLYDRVANAVQ